MQQRPGRLVFRLLLIPLSCVPFSFTFLFYKCFFFFPLLFLFSSYTCFCFASPPPLSFFWFPLSSLIILFISPFHHHSVLFSTHFTFLLPSLITLFPSSLPPTFLPSFLFIKTRDKKTKGGRGEEWEVKWGEWGWGEEWEVRWGDWRWVEMMRGDRSEEWEITWGEWEWYEEWGGRERSEEWGEGGEVASDGTRSFHF